MKIEVEARVFMTFPQSEQCLICHTRENKPCLLVPLDDTQEEGRERALPLHVDCVLAKVRLMPIEGVHLLYKVLRHDGSDHGSIERV